MKAYVVQFVRFTRFTRFDGDHRNYRMIRHATTMLHHGQRVANPNDFWWVVNGRSPSPRKNVPMPSRDRRRS